MTSTPARSLAGEAGQLGGDDLARAPDYRPVENGASSIGGSSASSPARAPPSSSGWMPTIISRLCADHGLCRRAVKLVRPPQPGPLLEQRAGHERFRQARRVLDVVRMPGNHRETGRALRAVSGRDVMARAGGRTVRRSGIRKCALVRLPNGVGRAHRRATFDPHGSGARDCFRSAAAPV